MQLLPLIFVLFTLVDAQSEHYASQFVETGHKARLNCSLQSNADSCIWTHNGETAEFRPEQSNRKTFLPWPSATVISKSSCDLEIDGIKNWRDSGLWSCHTQRDGIPLVTSQDFMLHVITAPILSLRAPDQPTSTVGK